MSNSPAKPPINLQTSDGEVFLSVRVQPKASRNRIRVEADGRVRIALTAAPVEGAANQALCAFLAKQLGLAKSAVRVVRGHASREKVIGFDGVNAETVRRLLYGAQD